MSKTRYFSQQSVASVSGSSRVRACMHTHAAGTARLCTRMYNLLGRKEIGRVVASRGFGF